MAYDDYNYCEECMMYGDNIYIDEYGNEYIRCYDCYENPDNYDDGYYIEWLCVR